ncbi:MULTISPECIES: M4 family metallopeptidase [Streptomyces]|uniref:Neutral metalloproteinase n=2 Tax=Streptomyces TaxID=1883 RepID=A0A2N8P8X1_STRNR|nr:MULTISPECIES: M4 family metallopeptidase [Streptomyces]PNE37471.1 flagellar biosynthesis protein FlgM [Streptomyces noursei]SHM18796.1 Zn-dependent metalloprotease [Streptomyces yunnanensis]
MRRPHIRSRRLAIALAVTTAATLSAGAAVATPASPAASPSAPSATGTPAIVDAARAAAYAHSATTGVGAQDTLKATDTLVDADGSRHVRFVRTHRGMPVLGGDLVVHLGADSSYQGVTRAARHTVDLPTADPKLSGRQAAAKAAAVAQGTAGEPRLVVDARAGRTALAYQVQVDDSGTAEAGGARTVVIDAATGNVLSNIPVNEPFLSPSVQHKLRQRGERLTPGTAVAATPPAPGKPAAGHYPAPATGSGVSFFVGTVPLSTTQTTKNAFVLRDSTRGNTETRDAGGKELDKFLTGKPFTSGTNSWGNGTAVDRTTAAVDAQFGITSTLDFYKKTFGRKGIKNDGAGAHALVHYGANVGNAFWSSDCGCMLYGDGDGKLFTKPLVVLDVTGHELTHGVVDATARLEPTRVDPEGRQFGEPGALNESLADIFGSAVEFATNNPKNPPNYLMGEKLGLAQKFLRRLDKPSLDKLEGTVDYWSKDTYDTEVHAGSGVSSHAFYLLAEGSGKKTIGGVAYDSATYDGAKVTGIGRDKALAIFYRALTRYMVSTTDFHDARTATLQAAKDLYGAGSTAYRTVDRAWAAVNVTAANAPRR